MSNRMKLKPQGVVTVRLGEELAGVCDSLAKRQGLSLEAYLVKLAEQDVKRFVNTKTV